MNSATTKRLSTRWLVLLGLVAIGTVAIAQQPVIGAQKALTKSAAKKLFYTKSQSNKRFVGKGEIRIAPSMADWNKTNPVSPVGVNPSVTGTSFTSGSVSTDILAIGGPTVTMLGGKPMKLVGVNACYVTPNTPLLTEARVSITDTATNNTAIVITDSADRSDDACRDYVATTPIALDPTDTIFLEYVVDFPGGGGQTFIASRATFIFTQ